MRRNEKGFGLVEVLIATGLIGGLALLVMRMNESGIQGVGKVEKNMEILNLDQEINNYLSDSQACLNSIGAGINVSSFSNSQQKVVTKIANRNDITIFSLPFKRAMVQLKTMFLSKYDPSTKTALLTKEYIYQVSPTHKTTKHKVVNLAIQDAGGVVTGCIMKASASGNGPWVVESNYIYYPSGLVGIGTSSPVALLHVKGTGGNAKARIERSNKSIWLDPNQADGNAFAQIAADTGMGLDFTVNGPNQSPSVSITSSGNVGIGTIPKAKLDVAGALKIGSSNLCNGTLEGTIRYNSGPKKLEFCNGSLWAPVSSNGFSQTRVVTATLTGSGSTSSSSGTVSCAADEKVTGGGVKCPPAGFDTSHSVVLESYPVGNGWAAVCLGQDGGTVYAICAK